MQCKAHRPAAPQTASVARRRRSSGWGLQRLSRVTPAQRAKRCRAPTLCYARARAVRVQEVACLRTSALLSAFLSRCSRNLTDLVGHRTWVAGAPGTFLRYDLDFFRLIPRIAAAVTHVFLKCTRRSEP